MSGHGRRQSWAYAGVALLKWWVLCSIVSSRSRTRHGRDSRSPRQPPQVLLGCSAGRDGGFASPHCS
ncbi:hypothetical protein PF005_g9002 [Phytophthora fragariae]|uniref:Secreted protein n=1 Tax=Phytophthora fragariae TaxID=53985 RepID=A0A6A3YF70_9STRA|nr:hypothetical protein PF003_g11448 [Phytophthora fragariae]KAE8940193.1 hypothetical protein PF009_g9987 [Phytophthora fragariae]KAE9014698.1 hypothetical protein PF011_g7940 [Phytophthora fragariae]KAE9118178.1 hypothetical protein PF010_g8309 [Phytophthora fragariae]KAE9118980.1 hypothetical protein PF007_g8722 [Phytophthora fragariae]